MSHEVRSGWISCVAAACLMLAAPGVIHAAAPLLYSQAAHQSPVRGEPDDLLLLAGFGFQDDDVVVYQAVRDTEVPPTPADVPEQSDSMVGVAEVVSTANVPVSLTIKLPRTLVSGQTYSLRVRTAEGEWSAPVLINDARPLWLTPAYVHERASVANLDRALRIVGRNLKAAPGAVTRARLAGPATWVLQANRSEEASLDDYVAEFDLPEKMPAGTYNVALSRDAISWIELHGQTLEVRPDPGAPRTFAPSAAENGGCRPDDEQDDLLCILRAVERAAAAGGATVSFDAGVWNLSGRHELGSDGIIVPQGVSLRGAGAAETRIVRSADWQSSASGATFTLLGRNAVERVTFADTAIYRTADSPSWTLKLGRGDPRQSAQHASGYAVEDVIISQNKFERGYHAIHDAGLPLRRLFITHNEFGSFAAAIRLAGNRSVVTRKFQVEDGVIRHNSFKPGSFLDLAHRQGAAASEIGAGHRVDFSDNAADGSAVDYLYSPEETRGWRAGFFWHMAGNHEKVLVSRNLVLCTDKIGDGEAIAYDGNGNTFAFDRAQVVQRATRDTVTARGPLRERQNGAAVEVQSYYTGHWVQIGAGPGLGQVRKIQSYEVNDADGSITFKVAPHWDVVPVAASTHLNVSRGYWQVYTVANRVDNRRPLCGKNNRSDPKAGGIVMWAPMADSVVEGNHQFDSDGILFQQIHSTKDASCQSCERGVTFISSVEIRGNTIDGEYDWSEGCSSSGIFGSLAASPNHSPQTVTFGLSIAHNVITRADGWRGGAITFAPTWHSGPKKPERPLVDNVLIHHNKLLDLRGPAAKGCRKDPGRQRRGISVEGASLVSRTVLYANSCPDAPNPIHLAADRTVRVCSDNARLSCECSR